ncbi:hypothetical protein O0L34_g2497 [Tuta absoluta]|nr:hypothetical protein O0L34_g2497 [Tuta absoluta]
MHARSPLAEAQSSSVLGVGRTMGDWWMMDREWAPDGSYDPYSYYYDENQEKKPPPLTEYYPPHAQQQQAAYSMVRPQPPPPLQPPAPAPAPPPPLPASVYRDYNPVVVPRG